MIYIHFPFAIVSDESNYGEDVNDSQILRIL